MAEIGQLPDWVDCPVTTQSQRFLDAAVQSVESALDAFNLVRDQRRNASGNLPTGRLTDAEEDLLRSAVMFAGAGIDSTLKQLIRDTALSITSAHAGADKKLHDFATNFLSEGEIGVNPKRLASVLLAGELALPREALIAEYERALTGESLQSAQQVDGVCGALAVNDKDLRKRLTEGKLLDQMFRARNEMVHELDLRRDRTPGPGVRMKRSRKIGEVEKWVTEALSVAQEILNEVGDFLNAL